MSSEAENLIKNVKSFAAANKWLAAAGHPEQVATADLAKIMGHINDEKSEQQSARTNYMACEGVKDLVASSTGVLIANGEYADKQEGMFSPFEYASAIFSEFVIENDEGLALSYLTGRRVADPERPDLQGARGLFVSLTAQVLYSVMKTKPDADLSFLEEEENKFENAIKDLDKISQLFLELVSKFVQEMEVPLLHLLLDLSDLSLDDKALKLVVNKIKLLPCADWLDDTTDVKILMTIPKQHYEAVEDSLHPKIPLGEITGKINVPLMHEVWLNAGE